MGDSALSLWAGLGLLPPQEAVDYLSARGKTTISYHWQDVWQEENANQFTVSRLARADLLQAIYDGITSSVNGDLSRRDFARDIKALLVKEGWWGEKEVTDPATGEIVKTTFNPPRLKLIYDTNTRMANAAGQWTRIQRNKTTHPYLRYITKRDERVRISHRAWDNLTLPVDHPFWLTHYPPNGWRCRCRVVAISQAEYERLLKDGATNGKIITEAPPIETLPWKNPTTGEVIYVPVGIDPGFAYNPGVAGQRNASLRALTETKLAGYVEPLRKEVEKDLAAKTFEPQKTAKEAAKWAVDNNLVDYADYGKVHPDVANAWNKSLFDHLEEFPELRANQKFAGTAQAQFTRWYDMVKQKMVEAYVAHGLPLEKAERFAEARIKKPRVGGSTWAHSWMQAEVSGIAVNEKWGKSLDAFQEALTMNVKNGYHPPGCDTIKSVVDHELGHQLDGLLKLEQDAEIKALYNEISSRNGLREEVSRYASKNIKEFIAECWAESCNSADPRPAARTVARIIRTRYQSRYHVQP